MAITKTKEWSIQEISDWFCEKLAFKLDIFPNEVDVNKNLEDFGLDSTEALILAGEMESWLGFELAPTALWYYPTIAELSRHIMEELEVEA